ncbi:amino acid permease-domain-containing protein [Lasiosphaeris hirsuta]|uniref:Amino acid permease-domain-containing protein n=1 Tax=Lasiosphaeris hirsuta TaxID=260670 RepID=A0AA40AA89_9PEZI|nr:amino acid permease-domain-containing protein [Lasiosphaeris hirsuta]
MESSARTPLLNGDILEPRPARAKKSLSFWDGVALTLGIQIGSGIFISPALVARNTGSQSPALVVWTVAGLLAWACAACYIELGTRLPVNGGPQEYLAHCFGDLFGFLASWGCIFGVKPVSAAILALFIADYICEAADIGAYHGAVALAVVALVTAVNCTGNRLSNISTKILLVCKTISVGFVIVMGFAVLLVPSLSPPANDTPSEPPFKTSGSYTDALVAAMWTYSGWEVLSFVGGDLRNPTRNFPRVINASMSIVLCFTLFANVAYFSVLSFDDIARSATVGLTFSERFLGRAGSILYAVAICLSSLGTLNVKTFAAGRLTQAAAERGYLPLLIKTVPKTDDKDDEALSRPEGQPPQPILGFLCRPARVGDGSIPQSAIIFNSLVTTVFVLAGDISSLISFMGMCRV